MQEEDSSTKMKNAFVEVLKKFNLPLELDQVESAPEKAEEGFSDLISVTQEKLDELHERGEELLRKTGMSREQLEAYAANPNNFSKEQWEALKKLKEATDSFKREVRVAVGEEQFGKSVERKQKKQQHRFGKKKHWIPL